MMFGLRRRVSSHHDGRCESGGVGGTAAGPAFQSTRRAEAKRQWGGLATGTSTASGGVFPHDSQHTEEAVTIIRLAVRQVRYRSHGRRSIGVYERFGGVGQAG